MFGEKHDLIHELPEFKDRIHELKMNNDLLPEPEKVTPLTPAGPRIPGGICRFAPDNMHGFPDRF